MGNNGTVKNRLVDVDDSILVIIDVQDCFLQKYDDST